MSYPNLAVGDRVELVWTDDDYTNLEPGDQGVVGFIDDLATAHVDWDNGSHLGMVPGHDRIRQITKTCRGCSATLQASDPDVCEKCDLHSEDQ